MATTRLGQGAKFFRAEELRDQHGRLQPAPPIVLGAMASGGLPGGPAANPNAMAKLTELAKKPLSVQVSPTLQYCLQPAALWQLGMHAIPVRLVSPSLQVSSLLLMNSCLQCLLQRCFGI